MTELAKKNIKLLGIIFFPGILAFGSCFLAVPRPPKEAALIQNFNEHRAAFEQLREMQQADTNLSRVASWGVETPQRISFRKQFPNEPFQSISRAA